MVRESGEIEDMCLQARRDLKIAMVDISFDLVRVAARREFDYRKHNIAFTGKKTLVYSDGTHSTQATYNWSENQAINELTEVFNRISQTFEFGQRLAFEFRFQKLELDSELASMEDIAKRGGLAELHVIVPLL